MRVSLRWGSLVVAAAACGTPSARPAGGGGGSAAGSATAGAPSFTAALSSAVIEGDCPSAAAALTGAIAPRMKAEATSGDAKRKADRNGADPCVQSEVLLTVTLAGARTGIVRLAQVELQDGDGASLGQLTPRSPTQWDGATSTFVPWDSTLQAAAPLQVRYALSAPPTRRPLYRLVVRATIELPDGTIVASPLAELRGIAPEPMVKT